MDRLDEIIQNRKAKVEKLTELGQESYPSSTSRTHTNLEALEGFDNLQSQTIILVGRVRSMRDMGKLLFAHIEDGTARIQVLVKEEYFTDKQQFEQFKELVDIGDFLEFTGTLFKTKTEEKTLQASSWRMLAKSIRPLPSEHFGLEDEETKLRKRYLDILMNPEVKELFVKKAKFWQAFRQFMLDNGFLEMYMPVLEGVPGGAEADPFITHHNALDQDFYLRISLELPLKKMLVAGYEKVFELGRIFRNEGISATHLQDYTQLEFYWAYADFDMLLKFWQEMYQYVIKETFGTLKIETEGQVCDWSGEWQRVNYLELFQKHTGIDLESAGDEELKVYCDKQGITYEDFARRGRLMDLIFKKVRVNLPKDKPVFLINQPIELEPLAKKIPGNPKLVQRAQLIAYGSELGKGFGELNDPLDQRERFEAQAALREAGDSEAQMFDHEYVEAMEYGMPPAAGFGVADRLFSVLAGRPVREIVVFPPMREVAEQTGKANKTKLAVAVLNQEAKMEKWQELNTVGHLAASFAARTGKQLFLQDEIATGDDEHIKLNMQHAIKIKIAASSQDLQALSKKAKQQGLEVSEFTREMMDFSDDKKVVEHTKQKKLEEVEHLGVLVFGAKEVVEKLTQDYELLS